MGVARRPMTPPNARAYETGLTCSKARFSNTETM